MPEFIESLTSPQSIAGKVIGAGSAFAPPPFDAIGQVLSLLLGGSAMFGPSPSDTPKFKKMVGQNVTARLNLAGRGAGLPGRAGFVSRPDLPAPQFNPTEENIVALHQGASQPSRQRFALTGGPLTDPNLAARLGRTPLTGEAAAALSPALERYGELQRLWAQFNRQIGFAGQQAQGAERAGRVRAARDRVLNEARGVFGGLTSAEQQAVRANPWFGLNANVQNPNYAAESRAYNQRILDLMAQDPTGVSLQSFTGSSPTRYIKQTIPLALSSEIHQIINAQRGWGGWQGLASMFRGSASPEGTATRTARPPAAPPTNDRPQILEMDDFGGRVFRPRDIRNQVDDRVKSALVRRHMKRAA